MTIPLCARCLQSIVTLPSIYESLRNFLGLTPLRVSCWKHCWMSDAAWTEWKSYSRPSWNYVAWLPGNIPFSVFKSTTLGTRSLFVSARQQSEMSIQAQKSVLRLRISKSLTCDDLNELLTLTPSYAMRRSRQSASVFGGSATFARTSWSYCARGNGKQALIDEWLVSKYDVLW